MAGTTKTRPYNATNAGAVSIAECEITFAIVDERVLLADVPLGAVILDAWFEVTTAFDSGSSDELNIGWGAVGAGTSDDILDAVDATSIAVLPATRGIASVRMAAAQTLYAYHKQVGGDSTAGAARGYVMYVRTADNG